MFPYLVDGEGDPLARIAAERDELRKVLGTRGALLLRGFDIGGVDGFEGVVRALSGPPLTYAEKSSPRSVIKGQVYTSTDYPPDEEIFLHNENSYQASWPRTLYFHCVRPPETAGATPLADVREVYRLVDPDVRAEFERRGWMVVRNFHDDFGQSWQHVFGTEDRAEVEKYCQGKDITVEWLPGGLRTRAVRPAVHTHPDSGERVWFNHVTFFHVTTLAAELRDGLLGLFSADSLPTNTFYGDGGEIDAEVMAHLRSCYRGATTRFDYETDDVLVIDNMLTAHGREPFTGPRRIAVAMAQAHRPGETSPVS